MEKVYQEFKNEEFKMFGVDMFNGTSLQVNAMVFQEGITYPILLKGKGLIKGTENPQSRDELFIVDREGIIVFYKYYGIYASYSIDSSEVAPFIREALNRLPTSISNKVDAIHETDYSLITYQPDGNIVFELLTNGTVSIKAQATLQVYSVQGEKVFVQSSGRVDRILSFKISKSVLHVQGVYFAVIRYKNVPLLTRKFVVY